ncbi:hypothetical protein AOLI_G00258000 [Acnodon oligacanthus]
MKTNSAKRGRPPRKKTEIIGTKRAKYTFVKTESLHAESVLVNSEADKPPSQHPYSGTKDYTSSEINQIKQEPGHFQSQAAQFQELMQGSSNLQPLPSDFKTRFPKTEPHCVPIHLDDVELKTEPDIHEVVVNGERGLHLKEEREDGTKAKLEATERFAERSLRQDEEPASNSVLSCPYCSVSFTDFKYLEKHLKWTHRSNYLAWLKNHKAPPQCTKISSSMLSCSYCPNRFFTQRQLKAHMQRNHLPSPAPARKRYTCPQCDRSFDYIGNLQNHCRKCHDLDTLCTGGELSCSACGKSFAGMWGLGPHCCNELEEDEEHKPDLESDRPLCMDRGFLCRHCGKNCPTLQSLTIHMQEEHIVGFGVLVSQCRHGAVILLLVGPGGGYQLQPQSLLWSSVHVPSRLLFLISLLWPLA